MIRNIEYCVLDESIWIHGLKECDKYNLHCIDALKLLELFRECPNKVKLILITDYQHIIIEKYKNIDFTNPRSSNFIIRFNYLKSIITSDIINHPERYEWVGNFDIHSPNTGEYEEFVERNKYKY